MWILVLSNIYVAILIELWYFIVDILISLMTNDTDHTPLVYLLCQYDQIFTHFFGIFFYISATFKKVAVSLLNCFLNSDKIQLTTYVLVYI
jgi:hypothetical protein